MTRLRRRESLRDAGVSQTGDTMGERYASADDAPEGWQSGRMRRSRKPLEVTGLSRVRIPPPPLNQAVPGRGAASVQVRAVFQTATLRPPKSVDVAGSPLVSLITGARVAHRGDARRRQERQLRRWTRPRSARKKAEAR